MRFLWLASLLLSMCVARSIQAQTAPITLAVDLTDAPRRILHSVEVMPVTPGPLTLLFPQWIPGEHGPTGPIDQNAGLVMTDNTGARIKWERDAVNMFAYHVTIPAGASLLTIHMDFLATAAPEGFSSGASTSANLALLSWNELLLYPESISPKDIQFAPSIHLPEGWKFGTALEAAAPPHAEDNGQTVDFKPVAMNQLIDSPVLTGHWFREIRLAPEITPAHFLDLAGDGPEDIAISQDKIDNFSRLIRETGALYKSRHYTSYHFLVTLSDNVAHFGLEHHQSSDDRIPARTFVDDNQFIADGNLLPHEFTHSWNGKYRRPIGLNSANFALPMSGTMLWVYEGLTEYLGDVLATRCGIWTPEIYRERLATIIGYLNDERPGRTWRDLQDTATAAQILYSYSTASPYDNWRRNTDYYDEGELLWLEVDLTMRQKSNGKKSLNDFAASFLGLNGNTGPITVSYTFDQLVAALNAVVPNDWATFLRSRLDANTFTLPEINGLNTLSGYKLAYQSNESYWSQLMEGYGLDARYSLGLTVDNNGLIGDTILTGPAYKAGLAPGFRIIAVNGRAFTTDLLRAAIRDATGNGPAIELIVENTGYFKTVRIDYHGGERYPWLVRVNGTPARMDDILQPMTH